MSIIYNNQGQINMENLDFNIEEAVNEPIKGYLSGSNEKESLKEDIHFLKSMMNKEASYS